MLAAYVTPILRGLRELRGESLYKLGGFGASAKQSIGRSMMAKQISEIFEKSRAGFKAK